MTYFIKIKDGPKEAPAFARTHDIPEGLFSDTSFPLHDQLRQVFYQEGPHDGHPHIIIQHNNPRLQEVKESLDRHLDGYVPPTPSYRHSSDVRSEFAYGYAKDGEKMDEQYRQLFGNPSVEDVLKYAANNLKAIVDYAIENQKDIQVN